MNVLNVDVLYRAQWSAIAHTALITTQLRQSCDLDYTPSLFFHSAIIGECIQKHQNGWFMIVDYQWM